MKKCSNCAAENDDSALFCFSCGSKFDVAVLENQEIPVTHVAPETPVISDAPVTPVPPVTSDALITPVASVTPETNNTVVMMPTPTKKKNKFGKSAWIGLACVLVILGLIVTVAIKFSPSLRLGYGLDKLMSKNQLSVTMNLKTDIDKDVDELFEMVNFEARIHTNAKKNEVFMTIAAAHKKNDLIAGSFFIDSKAMYFDLPEVFGKGDYYYFDYYDYLDLDEEIDFNKYISMFDWNSFPKEPFLKIMAETVKENSDNSLSSTVIELKGKDIVRLMEDILEEAEDNEDVAKWLKKNLTKVLKAMIKDDVNFDIVYMDLDDVLDAVEDEDFEDQYMDFAEMMSESFSYEKEYMLEDLSDIKLIFDVKYSILNRIKNIDMTIEQSGEAMTMLMSFTDNNKPNQSYSTKKGNDIMDIEQDEIYDMIMDTYDVLLENISEEEELEDYLNDIAEDQGYYDYEEWLYQIVDEMTYYMYY